MSFSNFSFCSNFVSQLQRWECGQKMFQSWIFLNLRYNIVSFDRLLPVNNVFEQRVKHSSLFSIQQCALSFYRGYRGWWNQAWCVFAATIFLIFILFAYIVLSSHHQIAIQPLWSVLSEIRLHLAILQFALGL